MFTWICPQCGREVPPAYDDCPDCAGKPAQPASGAGPAAAVAAQSAAAPSAAVAAAPPPPPAYAPPPAPPAQAYERPLFGSLGLSQKTPPTAAPSPYVTPTGYAAAAPPYAPPQQAPQAYAPAPQFQPGGAPPVAAYAPPAYYPPPQQPAYGAPMEAGAGRSLPSWLLTVIFAVGFVVVVGGIYWLFGSSHGSSQAANSTPAPVNAPATTGGKPNPLQQYFEVSGVRFVQDAKQNTQAKFVIINHSDAEVSGLTGTITILGKAGKSEEPEGTITFSTNIGPNESKELTEPFNTKLRVYELPDWQNVATDLRITGPQ